jgi:hypothetical protein
MPYGELREEARQKDVDRKNLQFDLRHVAGELEKWRQRPENEALNHVRELEALQEELVRAAHSMEREHLSFSALHDLKGKGIPGIKGIKLSSEQRDLFLGLMKSDE